MRAHGLSPRKREIRGSGKTSVGRRVAERMGWTFIEGDDLHPEANRRSEGHFMPAGLLDSQLATLEPAGAGEVIHDLHVAEDVETLARTAIELIGRS